MSSPVFNPGDRVEYTGSYTPKAKGELGTVKEQKDSMTVNVIWDNRELHKSLWDNADRGYWGVLPENIRKVMLNYSPEQSGDTEDDI